MKVESESVETLQREVGTLVRERQQLRLAGAAPVELERNRQELVRSQRDLGLALIARYMPASA